MDALATDLLLPVLHRREMVCDHKLADTPDKLDCDRMARVVAGLTYVLAGQVSE